MAHVEAGRLDQRMPRQYPGRLSILSCRGVERHAGRTYRFQSAPVGEPVLAIKLDRVRVSARQLGSFRRSLGPGSVERTEAEAMALPTQIINQPEVIAGTLPVAVDFHRGRACFYCEREFLFAFGPGGHACKMSPNCPKTARSATHFARLRFNTLLTSDINNCRRRGSNPHSRREHDFESCASASSATPA